MRLFTFFKSHYRLLFTVFSSCLLLLYLLLPRLPEALFSKPYSALLFSEGGQLLAATIAADGQWRFPSHGELPERFIKALLTFEDKRFFEHSGVDAWALLRAISVNIRHQRVISGGSTISMQVIRLSRDHPPRTYREKFIEILLTLQLEWQQNKQTILMAYATHAPFGGNIVGLETAAWRYFQRAPNQLSWAESALLAVLPNSPGLIHLGRNRQQLEDKRNRLLHRLQKKGMFSELDLQLALLEPLPEKVQPLPRLAPHLLQTLRQQYPKQYRFHSRLNAQLQQQLSKQVERYSKQMRLQGIHNTAALLIDHRNFDVLAYIGNSSPVFDNSHGHAMDLIRRPRSSGSTFKPILYAAMLESGDILPETLIADVPSYFSGYHPQNYDRRYRGAVPAKVAIARSLNVPAVRMLHRYGAAKFYDVLRHSGITTLNRSMQNYGLSLILGGAETTVWDIAGVYANLANSASHARSRQQLFRQTPRLLDTDDQQSLQHADIGSAAAWLTMQALLDVNRPGLDAYWKNFNSGHRIAWKTGTSYGLRDAWAIGSNTHYTLAIWVGNASGEGRPGLTGLHAAAPLMFDIFSGLDDGSWFQRPERQMKAVSICEDDGYLANAWCKTTSSWMPRHAHFDRITPYHQLLHLDKQGKWQVNASCKLSLPMQHKAWFVLPPDMARYYQQHNHDYQTPPEWHPSCMQQQEEASLQIIYPKNNARIYIPTELSGELGQVILQAVHQRDKAILYWHLDDQYIGETQYKHQMGIHIKAGKHQLTVVDQQGHQKFRFFKVL